MLFGDYNPNGKTAVHISATPNNYLTTYDHKLFETEETSFGNMATCPQFDFGHGLSYTTFSYSDLSSARNPSAITGTINVSVKVTNAGRGPKRDARFCTFRAGVATLRRQENA